MLMIEVTIKLLFLTPYKKLCQYFSEQGVDKYCSKPALHKDPSVEALIV